MKLNHAKGHLDLPGLVQRPPIKEYPDPFFEGTVWNPGRFVRLCLEGEKLGHTGRDVRHLVFPKDGWRRGKT